jgi:uncharacterized OsmC-like protein
MATEITNEVDVSEPIIRGKNLTAVNHGGLFTQIDFGEYGEFATDEPIAHGGTGEGPSPLHTVLGALCGCEAVTFNRTAKDFDFSYEGISFAADYKIDIRGRMGIRGVRQHFKQVRLEATVTTSESEERLAEVVEETENRCPVFNLMRDANVDLEVRWIRKLPE